MGQGIIELTDGVAGHVDFLHGLQLRWLAPAFGQFDLGEDLDAGCTERAEVGLEFTFSELLALELQGQWERWHVLFAELHAATDGREQVAGERQVQHLFHHHAAYQVCCNPVPAGLDADQCRHVEGDGRQFDAHGRV